MAFEMVNESFPVIVRRVGKGEIVGLSGVGSYYFIKTKLASFQRLVVLKVNQSSHKGVLYKSSVQLGLSTQKEVGSISLVSQLRSVAGG
jgi:hypothetical protein